MAGFRPVNVDVCKSFIPSHVYFLKKPHLHIQISGVTYNRNGLVKYDVAPTMILQNGNIKKGKHHYETYILA